MKKIIFFKNGTGWLDETVTIRYRKLGLMFLCVAPVAIVAAIGCSLFSHMEKDLESIDITQGWGDDRNNEAVEQSAEDL